MTSRHYNFGDHVGKGQSTPSNFQIRLEANPILAECYPFPRALVNRVGLPLLNGDDKEMYVTY